MANELSITENRINYSRGQVALRNHEICIGQLLSPTGTTSSSAAFSNDTNQITVSSSLACNIRIWDEAGTVTSANSEFLPANVTRDYEVTRGQVLSCIVI